VDSPNGAVGNLNDADRHEAEPPGKPFKRPRYSLTASPQIEVCRSLPVYVLSKSRVSPEIRAQAIERARAGEYVTHRDVVALVRAATGKRCRD
jgi:hypothetical protein